MHPVIVTTDLWGLLGEPIDVRAYGVLIAAGFFIGVLLASRQAAQEEEDGNAIVDLAFYALIGGLTGARLLFVATRIDYFWVHPAEIVQFWHGGLVFYGGVLGAGATTVAYARWRRLPIWKVLDILAPSLALGHAIGRLGCFAAGCCYGLPTTLPLGVVFPPASLPQQAHQQAGWIGHADPSLPVHPTQLYEAGVELALFWLLVALRPHKRFHGQLFLVWVTMYGAARLVLEMVRGEAERGFYWGLSTSQWLSLVLVLWAVVVFLWRRGETRLAAPEPQGQG